MKKFILSPYNSNWPVLFEAFKQKLIEIFGENLTAIYHIGSTSVEGMSAKPIIDIMPTVFSLEKVDHLKAEFEKAGFLWRGEFGISGRRYLTFDDPESGERLCHIHTFEATSLQVEKHLAFRDLMRNNFAKHEEYEQLKLKLYSEFPDEKDAYQEGKSGFIAKATAAALETQNEFRIPTQVYVWLVSKEDKQIKYLLLKRTIKSGGFWQGITGAPFANEEIETAAMRELFEETGIALKEMESLNYGYCFPLAGEWKKAYRLEVEKIVEQVFYAFVSDLVKPQLSNEHEQFKWCSYEESLELLKWQTNKDSLQRLHRKLS
jgi:GrpB-like predicted nucleotidyltransferase (UPF0157 family)/8-oxo-dGTP pyrophosphatase MutT (NUDIX family)